MHIRLSLGIVTWIVKLCDNTSILTFFVAKNLTNGMFYMFLTIIWLIYHCSSFQDQHLTFFAPNLGPNLIASTFLNKILHLFYRHQILSTMIFLPPSKQRFSNLPNKSLCYKVIMCWPFSLFVSLQAGWGSHCGGTKSPAWPGSTNVSSHHRSEAGHGLAAVNHNPAST